MNLFDMMRQAGGGNAFSTLGSQHGLSEDQISRALQAFLPAFSAGLKQSTADPLGLMEFMRRLGSGDYARAYRNPDWASGPGRTQGEEALQFLFGSSEVARAVTDQAAKFTGLAQEKLNELLPAMTAMMFGGLAEQSRSANPMLDAMMRQFQSDAADAKSEKGPLDRYEEEQAQRGGAGIADMAQAQQQAVQAGLAAFQAGTSAWQQAMTEMMKGGAKAAGSNPAGQAMPKLAAGPAVFGEMFEPGRRLSEAYQREMEAMLGRLGPAGNKPR